MTLGVAGLYFSLDLDELEDDELLDFFFFFFLSFFFFFSEEELESRI